MMTEVSVHWRRKQHFALEDAVLCLNCDCIYEIAGTCPACSSPHCVPVARFLNRIPR